MIFFYISYGIFSLLVEVVFLCYRLCLCLGFCHLHPIISIISTFFQWIHNLRHYSFNMLFYPRLILILINTNSTQDLTHFLKETKTPKYNCVCWQYIYHWNIMSLFPRNSSPTTSPGILLSTLPQWPLRSL